MPRRNVEKKRINWTRSCCRWNWNQ